MSDRHYQNQVTIEADPGRVFDALTTNQGIEG
jgi:uncharacterized protein YndB with AHSA1/START domain